MRSSNTSRACAAGLQPLGLSLRTVRGIGYLLEKAAEQPMTPYSLRRRLLLWLFLATALIGLVALVDTWREALRTAQGVSDRVLVGSALAIAERVTVDEAGGLEVDIPYSSLEMLTSTAQDKVFYRVDGPVGSFLTGYEDLAVTPPRRAASPLPMACYGDVGIRSATLMREVSTGEQVDPLHRHGRGIHAGAVPRWHGPSWFGRPCGWRC